MTNKRLCLSVLLVLTALLGCAHKNPSWYYPRPAEITHRKTVGFYEVVGDNYNLVGYLRQCSTLHRGLKDYVDEYFVYDGNGRLMGLIDELGRTYMFDKAGEPKKVGEFEIQTGALYVLGHSGNATFTRTVK
ncbi:MAG: hypothetical protein RDV41_02465 [Planctomycetota bacterium]|nr:hypothetical protein [Planctomycetota bacterium]